MSGELGASAQTRQHRRARARRAYALLLAAARSVVDEHGVRVSIEDIADRAGLPHVTARHLFPSRHELLAAVYVDAVMRLCGQGGELAREQSSADALFSWLRQVAAHTRATGDLVRALADGDGARPELIERWDSEISNTTSELLRRARRGGSVRADVAVSDVLTAARALASCGADSEQLERMLALVRRGAETSCSESDAGFAMPS